MKSMSFSSKNCQAVADRERGVVVAIDVSKRKMDFAAFRPDMCSGRYSVKQDTAGLRVFRELMEDCLTQGYDPWFAFEPTGPYSTCLKEWVVGSPSESLPRKANEGSAG